MRPSIRAKVIAALVAGIAVIAIACAALTGFVYQRVIRVAAADDLRGTAQAFAHLEDMELQKLAAALALAATNEELRRAFEARDRARLLALALPAFRELQERSDVTHWYFIAPDRTCFLRVHRPDLHGDVVDRPTLRRAVATGALAAGQELGRTAFALRAVVPWRAGDRVVGYLEMAEDSDHVLDALRAATGDDYALYVEKGRLDRESWAAARADGERWEELPAVARVAGRLRLAEGALAALLPNLPDEGRDLPPERGESGRVVRGVFPLRDVGSEVLGGVVVQHDTTPLHAGVAQLRLEVVALVVLLAVAFAGAVVFMLDALVFERLARMARIAEELPGRVARGEFLVEPPPDTSDDEIGRFERLFHNAIDVVWSASRELKRAQQAPEGPRVRRP